MKSRRTFLVHILVLLALCLTVVSVALSQQRKRNNPPVRLDSSKPTVYLSLQENLSNHEGKEEVRLKLHNNTQWNLVYYLVPKEAKLGDVPIIYKVEDSKRNQVHINLTGDVVIQEKLPPGKSVSFVVAREHLNREYTVYVEFNYEWEIRDGISPYANEPNHRVHIGWYNLPKELVQ